MIPATIHLRGQSPDQRQLRTLPRRGDYIDQGGRLWIIAHVVFDGQKTHLYLSPMSDGLAAELRAGWATWADPLAAPEPTGVRGEK